jgi:hypothetical protein
MPGPEDAIVHHVRHVGAQPNGMADRLKEVPKPTTSDVAITINEGSRLSSSALVHDWLYVGLGGASLLFIVGLLIYFFWFKKGRSGV